MKSDLWKNPEERSLGERGKFPKVKGKEEWKVEWCDLLSFPPSIWQRSFWHFSTHRIWLAAEIELWAYSIHGEGAALSDMSAHDALFTDPAIPKIYLVKAASRRCWTRGEKLYSAFFVVPSPPCLLFNRFTRVYLQSYQRALTKEVTLSHFPLRECFFRETEAGLACLCIPSVRSSICCRPWHDINAKYTPLRWSRGEDNLGVGWPIFLIRVDYNCNKVWSFFKSSS